MFIAISTDKVASKIINQIRSDIREQEVRKIKLMAVTITTSELFKRIVFRYYPIILLISLPKRHIAKSYYYSEISSSLLFFIGFIGPIYFWLIIILSLYIIKPVGFVNRLAVMIIAYLTGIILQHVGLTLYLGLDQSIFSMSNLSIRLIFISLLTSFYTVGAVVLAERSLTFEKTYMEEKTERLSSEKQLMENQLNLLQAKVEPRFLFTIMDRISDLFDTAPDRAKTIQMYFVQYLRSTLVKARESVTTVKQEIEHIQSYLDIIKIGMYERLEYQIEIDPQTKDLPFPSMLIQPIVENAISNAFDENLHEGRISISVKKIKDMIRVKTSNTNKGYKEDEKVGDIIEDVKERITRLFGDKGGLYLEENIPSRLTVIIEVPCE